MGRSSTRTPSADDALAYAESVPNPSSHSTGSGSGRSFASMGPKSCQLRGRPELHVEVLRREGWQHSALGDREEQQQWAPQGGVVALEGQSQEDQTILRSLSYKPLG